MGRAFIEAGSGPRSSARREYFPSFFGGAFIEASDQHHEPHQLPSFPFLSGRDFIEAPLAPSESGAYSEISLPFWKGFH